MNRNRPVLEQVDSYLSRGVKMSPLKLTVYTRPMSLSGGFARIRALM